MQSQYFRSEVAHADALGFRSGRPGAPPAKTLFSSRQYSINRYAKPLTRGRVVGSCPE